MPRPTFQELLAGAALLILGGLGFFLLFEQVPQVNSTSFTFILGALSGAITAGGGQKVAQALGAGAKADTDGSSVMSTPLEMKP